MAVCWTLPCHLCLSTVQNTMSIICLHRLAKTKSDQAVRPSGDGTDKAGCAPDLQESTPRGTCNLSQPIRLAKGECSRHSFLYLLKSAIASVLYTHRSLHWFVLWLFVSISFVGSTRSQVTRSCHVDACMHACARSRPCVSLSLSLCLCVYVCLSV